jgi:hypothetical protein
MTSFALKGNLSPDAVDVLAATRDFDDGIDLQKDGTHLIVKSGSISYFATVKDRKVTEYFCSLETGARVPSFTAEAMVGEGRVCYMCAVEGSGGYAGGHVKCVPIMCPPYV